MIHRSQAHLALGQAVRSYRLPLKLSQEELAHRSGLHRTYLGGIERGERNPSFANLIRVGEALGIDAWQLLYRASQLEREASGRPKRQ